MTSSRWSKAAGRASLVDVALWGACVKVCLVITALLSGGCAGAMKPASPTSCAHLGATDSPAAVHSIAASAWGQADARGVLDLFSRGDALAVGGPDATTAYLRFNLPVQRAQAVCAHVVLYGHPRETGATQPSRVWIYQTAPLGSQIHLARRPPAAVGGTIPARAALASGATPLRIDVTEWVRRAARSGRPSISLALRAPGSGTALHFLSPRTPLLERAPALVLTRKARPQSAGAGGTLRNGLDTGTLSEASCAGRNDWVGTI